MNESQGHVWVHRACLVMAQLLEDSSFCEEFIQQCPAAVEVLNLVAQECSPGENSSLHVLPFSAPETIYLQCNIFGLVYSIIHCCKLTQIFCRGASWHGGSSV